MSLCHCMILGTPPHFIKHPMDKTVYLKNETTNLLLSCTAEGATFFEWRRKYFTYIPSNISFNVETKGYTSNLILINLQPFYTGDYRCLAKNDSGTGRSSFATIVVNG